MKTNRSNCPLTRALDIIGDKWSLLIIRDIIIMGKKTFTEFMKSKEKIATNILANRLELLIKHELLSVTKLPNDQKTKIYYLTDAGLDLYPIICELMKWSDRNLNKSFGPIGSKILDDLQTKPNDKLIANVTASYRSSRQEILNAII